MPLTRKPTEIWANDLNRQLAEEPLQMVNKHAKMEIIINYLINVTFIREI